MNWSDVTVMSEAGINYDDVVVMSEIGLNWSDVTVGSNPRLPTNLQIAPLAENIGAVGLLEPIHVRELEDGVSRVIRGHRRLMAMLELKDTNPKRFGELFPDGIPAIVWQELSDDEELMLKLDHGGQVTLSDPHELQMSATLMFAQNFTEAQVANQLKPLILKLAPMPPAMKAELKKIDGKVAEARKAEDLTAVAVLEKEYEERVAKGFRGRIQHLHNVARCPDIVNASLYYKACELKPEGFEDEKLPKLTTDQVKALWKAHSKDLEDIGDNGAPKFNKSVVGPLFVEKWTEILQKEADVKDGKAPKQEKAMSAKDMKTEITDGKWESVGFYKLTKHHSGDKSVADLGVHDKDYKALDLVKQFGTDLYDMVIQEAEKIEEKLKSEVEEDKDTETTDES